MLLVTSGLFSLQSNASTDNYAQQAQQTCQTLVAYRMGSLLDIQVTSVKPLAVANKWLVTGEVKTKTGGYFRLSVNPEKQQDGVGKAGAVSGATAKQMNLLIFNSSE